MLPHEREVHFSTLKQIAQSPAHYLVGLERPRTQTPAMRFGSLVHALTLGGEYVVFPGDRRGKAWETFRDSHPPDSLIVTEDEYARAANVRDAVVTNPIAAPLIVGQQELPLEWELNGRKCAGRLDVLGDGFLTDLKTASCSEPYRFTRGAMRLSYHAQMAWYADAAAMHGRGVKDVYIVAVETAPPFAVTVLRLTPRALDEGRKLCRLWLERLLGCEASNEWPAYTQSIVDFDVNDDVELIIDGEEIAA